MKNILFRYLTLVLLLITGQAMAQTPANFDMAKMQEQLKAAQELIKQKMGANSDSLNAALVRGQMKATDGYIHGGNIPDSVMRMGVGMLKIPDPSKTITSVNANLAKNMAAMQGMQKGMHQSIAKNLPQKSAASFSAVPNADRAGVIAYANAMMPTTVTALKTLNPKLQEALDAIIKADTTMSVAGKGMLMMADGEPKAEVKYMVCKGVLAAPDDPWAVNDLGVILRADGRYQDAAKCFKYALGANDKFIVIKSNLAWAVAYMGDFQSAKSYFRDILQKEPNYQLAWEGLGMMAYQEGDIATLFQCLANQVKTVGAGGSGPSGEFTSFVDAVGTEQTMANVSAGQGSPGGSSQDNTMDNNNGEDEGNQDPPPTANSEYPTYPESMGGMFANSIEQLEPLAIQFLHNTQLVKSKIKEAADKTAGKLQAITRRLAPAPYQDDQGMTVTPANYEKWYTLFHDTHKEFEKRCSRIYQQYDEDFKNFTNTYKATSASFADGYIAALRNCKFTNDKQQAACINDVYCIWQPKAKTELGANLLAISQIFTKCMNKMRDQSDWYISASSPDVKRVHDPGWNEYMNAIREEDIRHGILNLYNFWLVAQTLITNGMELEILKQPAYCTTEVREIPATGPDPTTVHLKKLKTAPEYCDRKEPPTSAEAGFFSFYSDCDVTRYGFSPPTPFGGKMGIGFGPVSLKGQIGTSLTMVYEQVRSSRHQEDNYSNLGMTLGVGASITAKLGGSIKDDVVHGTAEASAKAGMNGTMSFGTRFDANGAVTGKYINGDVNAGISNNITIGEGVNGVGSTDMYSSGSGAKADVHGEIFMGVGPNGSPGAKTMTGGGSVTYK